MRHTPDAHRECSWRLRRSDLYRDELQLQLQRSRLCVRFWHRLPDRVWAASCSVNCQTGTKCNTSDSAAVSITCADNTECKGTGGDGSSITCNGSTKCELKAGANSTAACVNDADCKFNLGAGSVVECKDTSSCNIKCDDHG